MSLFNKLINKSQQRLNMPRKWSQTNQNSHKIIYNMNNISTQFISLNEFLIETLISVIVKFLIKKRSCV